MIRLNGKGMCKGITLGTIKYLDKNRTLSSVNQNSSFIVFADSLSINTISKIDAKQIAGICTVNLNESSHAFILAKTWGIPIVSLEDNIDLKQYNEKFGIINGNTGEIIIDPDPKTCCDIKGKIKDIKEKQERLLKLKGKESITLDGRKINILATANKISDINAIIENDAEGIGIFRSEFLFLNEPEYPTEDLQFEYYKHILERMKNKPVVIRTADIGGDKSTEYINIRQNNNPALNIRGIRASLKNPDYFKIQLRALYRASIYGNLSIMLPMIISLEEVIEAKRIIAEVKKELTLEEISFYDKTPLGIMIETPSAVMISDLLAEQVDFFSIGTNDLTQYTLAVDRQTKTMKKSLNPAHQSVIRMIERVIHNAHSAGINVCICGQLADDLNHITSLIELEADEISTSPLNILPIREIIRNYKK